MLECKLSLMKIGRNKENNNLMEDPEKYPNGIKALADYIHEKGLYLGITGGASYRTCGDLPGFK